jgi:hypothetical protein
VDIASIARAGVRIIVAESSKLVHTALVSSRKLSHFRFESNGSRSGK